MARGRSVSLPFTALIVSVCIFVSFGHAQSNMATNEEGSGAAAEPYPNAPSIPPA
jgi:hypothetical protein